MSLAYKLNLASVVERHRLLWTGRLPHAILAIMEPEEARLGSLATAAARQAPDLRSMVDVWEERFALRRGLLDDSLPVARVSFGSSAFGGYLGADVRFGEGGGASRPLVTDWSMLPELRFDQSLMWIRRQQDACRYFTRRAEGRFAVCETETIDALNLADVLRGTTQALLDLHDHPQELRLLMDFGVRFNLQLIEMQREILGSAVHHADGVFSMHYIWLPGHAVWLSVDAYGMCRPEVFDDFGCEFTQRLIDYFGAGWMHVHAGGQYLLPSVLKLRRLLGVSLCEDPGCPRPFERMQEIRSLTGDMPLEIWCHKDELLQGISSGSLPGGVLYRVDEVQSVHDANEIMEQVWSYRAAAG